MRRSAGSFVRSIVLPAGAFAALLWLVDFQSLLEALSSITAGSLLALVLIGFLLIYVSVLKWRLFLLEGGSTVGAMHLFGLYLVGYFVNLIMPSYVGGDAVRSFYLGKKTGQHEAAAATILERYTGLVAMVVLGFMFMWLSALVPGWVKLLIAGIACGLAVGSYVAVHPAWTEWLTRVKLLAPAAPHIRKVQAALKLAARSPRLLLGASVLSLLFHSLTVLNVVACAWAVGWDTVPFWDLFVVLPIILLLGALPLTPQGLGVTEFGFMFFLQTIGATDGQALGIALVLRAKQYLLGVLGWFYWVRLKEHHRTGIEEDTDPFNSRLKKSTSE